MTNAATHRTGPLLAVLLTALFMMQADATIVNVANPSIHADMHASGAELELVVGGYLLAFATLLITGARVGQMRGHRRVFLAGLAVFTLASLACGLAPTPIALVVARIVQGTGAALMVPQVLTSIQVHLDGHERVRALGLYSAALAGGAVAGQILGGVLVSADLLGTQWRPIFLINVPVGLTVLAAGRRSLPADDGAGGSQRVDALGAHRRALAIPVGCLVLAGAHAALSAASFAGERAELFLVPVLGIGGFGLGMAFSAAIGHLTEAATPRYASDISGVFTTSLQVAGVIGVAAFGSAYLGLAGHPRPGPATHAFAVITAAFAGVALLAACAAHRATHAGRRSTASRKPPCMAT